MSDLPDLFCVAGGSAATTSHARRLSFRLPLELTACALPCLAVPQSKTNFDELIFGGECRFGQHRLSPADTKQRSLSVSLCLKPARPKPATYCIRKFAKVVNEPEQPGTSVLCGPFSMTRGSRLLPPRSRSR